MWTNSRDAPDSKMLALTDSVNSNQAQSHRQGEQGNCRMSFELVSRQENAGSRRCKGLWRNETSPRRPIKYSVGYTMNTARTLKTPGTSRLGGFSARSLLGDDARCAPQLSCPCLRGTCPRRAPRVPSARRRGTPLNLLPAALWNQPRNRAPSISRARKNSPGSLASRRDLSRPSFVR